MFYNIVGHLGCQCVDIFKERFFNKNVISWKRVINSACSPRTVRVLFSTVSLTLRPVSMHWCSAQALKCQELRASVWSSFWSLCHPSSIKMARSPDEYLMKRRRGGFCIRRTCIIIIYRAGEWMMHHVPTQFTDLIKRLSTNVITPARRGNCADKWTLRKEEHY